MHIRREWPRGDGNRSNGNCNQNEKNASKHRYSGNIPHQMILLPKTQDVLSFPFPVDVIFLINAF